MKPKDFFFWIPVCPHCGERDRTVERRMTNMMYQDDEMNYIVSCLSCFDEYCRDYEELFDDIYSDIRASISDALLRR